MQDKRSGLLGVMARGCVLIQQGVYIPLGGVNKSLNNGFNIKFKSYNPTRHLLA